MSVLSEAIVSLEAAGVSGWQREVAESLAKLMDESPNASTSKEFRTLMVELVGSNGEVKADVSDDLAAKRERRRQAAVS